MDSDPPQHTMKPTLVELQARIRGWERRTTAVATEILSTNCRGLDVLFPSGGIRPGSLVEWISGGDARGAETLSLLVCRGLAGSNRPLILIDPQRQIYPVALSALGFDLSSVTMIQPSTDRETLWACEESLRCAAVGIVWSTMARLSPTAFRRLQLAVEESGVIGFLSRPASALNQPSWADVRLMVQPRPSRGAGLRFQVEVIYSQGSSRRTKTLIEMNSVRGSLQNVSENQETQLVPLVSRLAHSATADFPPGAMPYHPLDQRPHSTWRLRLLHQ